MNIDAVTEKPGGAALRGDEQRRRALLYVATRIEIYGLLRFSYQADVPSWVGDALARWAIIGLAIVAIGGVRSKRHARVRPVLTQVQPCWLCCTIGFSGLASQAQSPEVG